MNYIQITIGIRDANEQDLFIALMTESGYEGFEQDESFLWAYIPEGQFEEATLDQLLAPFGYSYTRERIEERNWNEEWEKNFQPVQVDRFCAVRASFHEPLGGVEHELIITPKMSFGTGHHATTYMMLEAMQHLDFKGRRVLDFGTGTGVLAILAERLGALDILAIDHDPWSINNAGENVAENHCSRIRLLEAEEVPAPGEEGGARGGNELWQGEAGGLFDIILANINKHVILSQLDRLRQQLKGGGVILLSGLLIEDFEDIENEAIKNNLPISNRITRGNWICCIAEKRLN